MLARVSLSLQHIEQRLAGHEPVEHSRIVAPTRAAVAALLRYRGDQPDVLLMQRAAAEGDRWSGHVSFPGGREEVHDPNLVATAMRETHEEVGIDLSSTARLLGRSDSIRARARGKFLPMSVTPFVFVQTAEAEIVCNQEAETTFWLPLAAAANGDFDDSYAYKKGPLSLTLPCWRYQGHTVWGLTYQMLMRFLQFVRS